MATAPTLPLISVDEYLKSSWHPDMEYVDGALVERNVPTIAHGLLRVLLLQHFWEYRKNFQFAVVPEVRTQIIERARYRIPDVMICPLPLPPGKVVTTIPWAVIEILSPEDKTQLTLERFRDYAGLGVRSIVLLDPERTIAHRYDDDSLIRTEYRTLELPAGPVPFDSAALFRQLREEHAHDN
jgi:Uma2 family endonuclease